MAVTGKGKFPLISSWYSRRYRSSLAPMVNTVFAIGDKDNTEVTIFNDWFFPSSVVNYQLTAQGGSYNLIGFQTELLRSKYLIISGGSYTLEGVSAILLVSKLITASSGTYNLIGTSADLNRNRVLTTQGGSYTYSGQQITITYIPGITGYTLTCQGGSYNINGQNAVVLRDKLLVTYGGNYSYLGQDAVISKSKLLVTSGGSYNLSGQSANIIWATAGGVVWPLPSQVLLGIVYGPTGTEYTGTLDVYGIKFDITTGELVKPISNKAVMTL